MQHRGLTTVIVLLFLAPVPLIAQEIREADPLFRSDAALEVTIAAPLSTLMSDRPLEEELPGTFSYTSEAGALVQFDIELRTRGRYRHQKRTCPFAPLRLNFDKSETSGTLFDKQDKLKLVTHCKSNSERFHQTMLREYLNYRFLNALTDLSFRVRLLKINYVDTEDPGEELVRYGFLIEHRDRLAKRIGLPHLELDSTSVTALHGEYTNLVSVFQFFIANTDYSPIAGAPDDFCCHNTNLFGKDGGPLYAIPYDFDMSGLTDADYATPNPKFPIRSVRQRLYRGRCNNNQYLPQTLAVFREHRAEFAAMVQEMPLLDKSSKRRMTDLIEDFDKLIDKEKSVQRKMVRACVG